MEQQKEICVYKDTVFGAFSTLVKQGNHLNVDGGASVCEYK